MTNGISAMKAARLYQLNKPLRVEECPIPKVGNGEVLLKVKACGVCGSDLTIIKGGIKGTLPCTLGHEIAGIVVDVGKGLLNAIIGMRAVVFIAIGCGKCVACSRGEVFCCSRGAERIGITQDGGFAEYVLVPAANLIPLPESLSFEAGAVLTDAVATCLHALEDVAKIASGETVAVFGIGGLATSAIQIAKMHKCRVLAISRSKAKLDLALSLGADEAIVGGDTGSVIRSIRRKTNNVGVEVALQLVPDPEVDEQALASLATFGRAVLVGFTSRPFQASSLALILNQSAVVGSRGMTRDNILRAIHLVEQDAIRVEPLLQMQRPLGAINAVLEEFRAGKLVRAVIRPEEH